MREEPGRHLDEEYGMWIIEWPPVGRFKELWERLVSITTEQERMELVSMINKEIDDNSTLVSYTDDECPSIWHDVTPDWTEVEKWLDD